MNIRNLHDRISTNLATIKSKVQIENAANDQGLNILFETVFLKIYNILYGCNLVNSNLLKNNSPGVDGVDYENKIFVQVSSTFSNDKINHTVEQILKNELYKDFDKLVFLFLKEKKKLTKAFKETIINKITDKFSIDFEKDFINLDDVYRTILAEQDVDKSLNIKKILDEVLHYIPTEKISGYDFIGISFDDEEIDNVAVLTEAIAKGGMNVVTNSKRFYSLFQQTHPRYFDYLILTQESQNLDYLSKTIAIISNNYIVKNIDSSTIVCSILANSIEKGLNLQLVTFKTYINPIKNKRFRNPKTLSKNNTKKIDEILEDLFALKPSSSYSFDEIREVLIKLLPKFKLNVLANEKNYCVYNFKDKDHSNEFNYLIFSNEYRRAEVLEDFHLKFKDKIQKSLTILIPKDYNQSTNQRLTSVAERYKNVKVSYIEDYLFEESLENIEQIELLINENFIEPFFKIRNNIEKLDDILDWVKNGSTSSVAFIVGAGGIGKTTVCEKIHDEIVNEFDKNIVLFLNASAYISEIKRRESGTSNVFNLVTIFEMCHTKAKTIDLNTFKANFILGNIVVIIDGIDEIISTLPNFSLKNFVDDLNSLKEQIGKGKLIINCRDIYIQELINSDADFENKHKVFELLKFDKDLARKYFEQNFTSDSAVDSATVENCLRVLDEFYENESAKYIYSPFVLEIIVLIVQNDFRYEEIEYRFDSKILSKDYANDYLIYKICLREIAKKENFGFILPVDDYIKFLCLVAIENNGHITDDDFMNLLRQIQVNLSSEKVKSSLKDNPFFTLDQDEYKFRFDFYISVFKINAFYSKMLNIDSFNLSDAWINVLADKFKYNSIIFKGLKTKFKTSNYDLELLLENVKLINSQIENYRKSEANVALDLQKKRAISNLALFLFKLTETHLKPKDVIARVFKSESQSSNTITVIENFYIVDLPVETNITLDFSDLIFSNCYIDNYPMFIYCNFSDDTYFLENCTISNVYANNIDIKKVSLQRKYFDDKFISNDNSLYKIILMKESGGEPIDSILKKYFLSFYSFNNKFTLSITTDSIDYDKNLKISLGTLNKILKKHGIVASSDSYTVTLNKNFQLKINKFITQNLTFIELNKVFKDIDDFNLQ